MIVQNENKFGAFSYYNFPKKITFPFVEAPIDFRVISFCKERGFWGLIYPNSEEFKNETPFEIILSIRKISRSQKDLDTSFLLAIIL